MLCVPMGRTYGALFENGKCPDDGDGKLARACMAEDMGGGGGSTAFAFLFRVVGESIDRLREAFSLCVVGVGGIDV